MINVASNLSNLKSKVEKSGIDKLVSVPVVLSKLSNVVKIRLLKRIYIMLRSKILKIKYLITKLATYNVFNTKINRIEKEMPSITNVATTAAEINEVKNNIPDITSLAITIALKAVENIIPDYSKYITTSEFSKLTVENFLKISTNKFSKQK